MNKFITLLFIAFLLSSCATTSEPDLNNYPTQQQPSDSSIAAETAARI